MPLTFELRGKLITIDDTERTECEIWSRVRPAMGYYRPVSEFNIGKKSEFRERKFYRETELTEKKAVKEVIANPLQPL